MHRSPPLVALVVLIPNLSQRKARQTGNGRDNLALEKNKMKSSCQRTTYLDDHLELSPKSQEREE